VRTSFQKITKRNLQEAAVLSISLIFAISVPLFASHYVNSIYDTSYFLTNGLRIALGQHPYKDFILVHNPGSFLIIGFLFKIMGTSYLTLLFWICFVQTCSVIITNEILKNFNLEIKTRQLLLVFTSFAMPYSVVAANNYDSDSTLFILLAVYIFLKSMKKPETKNMLLLGVLTFLPFVIKQNVGGVFILAMTLIVIRNFEFSRQRTYILGLSLAGGFFLTYLYVFGNIENWWKYSVRFAAEQRLGDTLGPIKMLSEASSENQVVLSIALSITLLQLFFRLTPSIKFSLLIPSTLIVIVFLIQYLYEFFKQFSPDLDQITLTRLGGGLYYLSINKVFWVLFLLAIPIVLQKPRLRGEIPSVTFVCISILYAALLSQGVNGSTYGNAIFLILIPIALLTYKEPHSGRKKIKNNSERKIKIDKKILEKSTKISLLVLIYLCITFVGITGVTNGRLGFVDLNGEIQSNKSIQWIRTPGSFLPDQNYAQEILTKNTPRYSEIVFIPGAEFGYLLSGIAPTADVHTFDGTTNPYGADAQFFLECNKVQLIAYNSRNSVSMYFDFNVSKWPPPSNYSFLEKVGPFDLYERNFETNEYTSNDLCPTTSKYFRDKESKTFNKK
jgi:hypothetical protein